MLSADLLTLEYDVTQYEEQDRRGNQGNSHAFAAATIDPISLYSDGT